MWLEDWHTLAKSQRNATTTNPVTQPRVMHKSHFKNRWFSVCNYVLVLQYKFNSPLLLTPIGMTYFGTPGILPARSAGLRRNGLSEKIREAQMWFLQCPVPLRSPSPGRVSITSIRPVRSITADTTNMSRRPFRVSWHSVLRYFVESIVARRKRFQTTWYCSTNVPCTFWHEGSNLAEIHYNLEGFAFVFHSERINDPWIPKNGNTSASRSSL
jgi:hypothetical protein